MLLVSFPRKNITRKRKTENMCDFKSNVEVQTCGEGKDKILRKPKVRVMIPRRISFKNEETSKRNKNSCTFNNR